jgi:cell division protein FtsL
MFEKDPRTFEADMKGLSPEQKAMVKLEITLTQFFKSFNTSITRWERLVYPSLLVMAVLGISGFYLIYSVTEDMDTLTRNIDPQMEFNLDAMSSHMAELSKNIAIMTGQITVLVQKIDSMETHISNMDGNIDTMGVDIAKVEQSMQNMTGNIAEMNQSMRAMTMNTGVMSRDINQMGRPMEYMKNYSPW